MKKQISAVLLACLAAAMPARGQTVNTGSLLREMTDMARLADFPAPAFDVVQFSSYDRSSNLPGGPGWFANSDGFGKEPSPNFEAVLAAPDGDKPGEYLVCDIQGPGAVVRLWTAAITGSIRMTLDDAPQPLYDGPADEFFLRFYQRYFTAAGLDPKIGDGTFTQRCACYFPIPFAKRCRIVWIGDAKKIHFYHLNVRRYAAGAPVETFSADDIRKHETTIRAVAKVLDDPRTNWEYRSKAEPATLQAAVAPGEKKELLALQGPKAIERLTLKLDAADLDRALRQTVLHIAFDDYPRAQVESPVGDFFGAAPGVNPYTSVPFTVQPDGTMTCRFVMPFAKSCRIFVENLGEQPVTVSGSALPMEYKWNAATSMHLRARWRVNHDLVADNGNNVQDLPFLLANGEGRYVGTTSILLNPNPIPTPGGNWWGEGDEKIFVDADTRPSTFGTGSEDYYNYAWSSPDIFVYAYCGQPRNDGPANRGFVTNNRWHIIDDIPFRQRLAFYMELFSHERTPGVSYARIGYHYGRPGLMDDHVPITRENVRHLTLPKNWQPAARGGASNSVFVQAEEAAVKPATGEDKTSLVTHDIWAGGRMLAWRPAAKGDSIAFKLPVAKDGRHCIHITAARTPASGRVAVALDGKRIGFGGDQGMDWRSAWGAQSRDEASAPADLQKGEHILTLTCEDEVKKPGETEIGIDFFWVQQR